jgi:hypothetical protein
MEAVRTASRDTRPRNTNGPKNADADSTDVLGHYETRTTNPNGAPLLDWLNIPTQPYKGAHYAAFPTALVVPFVKAMCPSRVCRVCGEPSRRIVEGTPSQCPPDERVQRTGSEPGRLGQLGNHRDNAQYETLGWTECACPAYGAQSMFPDDPEDAPKWRNGVVLDPFAGSGTTLQVATGHGRDAIGIDLDERNVDLARARVGMFLTEEPV